MPTILLSTVLLATIILSSYDQTPLLSYFLSYDYCLPQSKTADSQEEKNSGRSLAGVVRIVRAGLNGYGAVFGGFHLL